MCVCEWGACNRQHAPFEHPIVVEMYGHWMDDAEQKHAWPEALVISVNNVFVPLAKVSRCHVLWTASGAMRARAPHVPSQAYATGHDAVGGSSARGSSRARSQWCGLPRK